MTTIPITKFFHICPQCKRTCGHPECIWTSPVRLSRRCIDCNNSENNKIYWVGNKFEEDCHILSDGVEGDGIW